MNIQRIEVGPRSSQAVIHGNTVYLAGQVARNAENAPIARQAREILDKIEDLLRAAGTDKSRLLSTTIFLSDFRYFNEMNDVWMDWVVPGSTPARAVVEAKLVYPGYGVEIMVTAALKVVAAP